MLLVLLVVLVVRLVLLVLLVLPVLLETVVVRIVSMHGFSARARAVWHQRPHLRSSLIHAHEPLCQASFQLSFQLDAVHPAQAPDPTSLARTCSTELAQQNPQHALHQLLAA